MRIFVAITVENKEGGQQDPDPMYVAAIVRDYMVDATRKDFDEPWKITSAYLVTEVPNVVLNIKG